jgi:AraC-like DNA-binding protein
MILVLLSAYFTHRLLKKYRKKLEDYYSYIGDKDLKTNHLTLDSIYLLYILFLIYAAIPGIRINASPITVNALTALMSVAAFIIGRSVLMIKFTADDFERINCPKLECCDEAHNGKIENGENFFIDVLDRRLQGAITGSEIYKQPTLTLDELAKQLQTNRTYLSRLIHSKYKQSFSDFINSHRIESAKQLLLSDDEVSLEWISIQSGFTTYNSFYTVFKQMEGCSPGLWRKSAKNKIVI